MFKRLIDFKIRKAIARAMTEQCDIDESNVVAKNVHIISSEPTMEGFDIEFTINGEDGEQFKTSIKNDGPFSEAYVSKIELVVPTYTHEVYYLRKNAFSFYFTRHAVVGSRKTRDEWLEMLYNHGVLDSMTVEYNFTLNNGLTSIKRFSNLGHPTFTTNKLAAEYLDDLELNESASIMESSLTRIPIEVWGVKPLSKTPVMLGAVDAASFDQACYILMESGGIGITMERDWRTRAYFFYNGRPVFTNKEAAQHCIDIEFGCREQPEEIVKIIDRLLNPKQITKVSDIKCFNQLASVIGKGQAQVELFKVMHNESCWVDIDVDDFALALDWALTPQGYDYWESLYVHIRKAKESNRNSCKSQ